MTTLSAISANTLAVCLVIETPILMIIAVLITVIAFMARPTTTAIQVSTASLT